MLGSHLTGKMGYAPCKGHHVGLKSLHDDNDDCDHNDDDDDDRWATLRARVTMSTQVAEGHCDDEYADDDDFDNYGAYCDDDDDHNDDVAEYYLKPFRIILVLASSSVLSVVLSFVLPVIDQ